MNDSRKCPVSLKYAKYQGSKYASGLVLQIFSLE